MQRSITLKLFNLVSNYKIMDDNVLDKIKECIQQGAESFCNRGNIYTTPVPVLYYSLDSLNVPVIQYLFDLYGIDKEHSHSRDEHEDFTGVKELWKYETNELTYMCYTRNYYSELRRLHSLIFVDYKFHYDLYKFYMWEGYRVKTEVSFEEFAEQRRTGYQYEWFKDKRFEGKQEYYYGIWKQIVELLGFTEEEILSKRHEDFLKDCADDYFHPSELEDSSDEDE